MTLTLKVATEILCATRHRVRLIIHVCAKHILIQLQTTKLCGTDGHTDIRTDGERGDYMLPGNFLESIKSIVKPRLDVNFKYYFDLGKSASFPKNKTKIHVL